MMEVKYFRDYNHNYIILKCSKIEEMGKTYRFRMLASNKIDRLLNCSVRNINGEAYFYYDISSKATLKNLYQGRKMSYEQVKDLFCQIDMIYQDLGQYFIKDNGLLIQPDYIYYDFTTEKYFGLYYPEDEAQTENPYEPLMDFLLNHVDTENQKLVDLIYQIYELSGESYFSIADTLTFFDDMEEHVTEAEIDVINKPFEGKEPGDVAAYEADGEPVWINDRDYNRYCRDNDNTDYDREAEDFQLQKIQTDRNKSRIYYGVFAVLSLCGIGAAIGIYYKFRLTQRELMIFICCAAVMSLCFLFSFILFLLSGKKIRKQDQEERELRWDIEDEFRDERPVVLQGVLEKTKDLAMTGNGFEENSFHKSSSGGSSSVERMPDKHPERYGETVFVDVQNQNREYKLYALDKKNKKHIELTQFPYTIGKMAGCVDCVLTDDSISRLHARFEKQDGKILLTDMNSKNGTYKNGLRMEPSETVEVEPGDEIRFGKLNYCYR